MDFAFFVANFGYSRSDYDQLTMTEKALIYRALEDKRVYESTLLQNVIEIATYNMNRKKGKSRMKLWRKKNNHINPEEREVAIKNANEIADKFGRAAALIIAGKVKIDG